MTYPKIVNKKNKKNKRGEYFSNFLHANYISLCYVITQLQNFLIM